MNETKLKLIGKPEEAHEEPQQPTFPVTNVQFLAQGIVITTMITPHLSIGQLVDETIINDWLASRTPSKPIKPDLGIIQHVKHTRND